MMDHGKIVLDVAGEERAKLTVEDLLDRFRRLSGDELDNDRMLLSELGQKGNAFLTKRDSSDPPCPTIGGAATLRCACFLRRTRRRKKNGLDFSRLQSRELCETFDRLRHGGNSAVSVTVRREISG